VYLVGDVEEYVKRMESALRAAREERQQELMGDLITELADAVGYRSDSETYDGQKMLLHTVGVVETLKVELAAERESRKQAEVEQFNAGWASCALEARQAGYITLSQHGKLRSAKPVQEPVSGSPERLEGGEVNEPRWICDGCKTSYAEYVNGCPRCYEHGLFFSVRQPPHDPAEPTPEPAQGSQEK
jgi:hypothetical protein